MPSANRPLIPLWAKLPYTAFMAVLIPIYLKNYGPTNFLYFCDVVAILTVVAIWLESPLLLSAALIGAFLPQMVWVADFTVEAFGGHLTGMTGYMFDRDKPFFLRFLSFFHFWLPFYLVYAVWCVGYDRRAAVLWSVIMWVLLTMCYVWMPPASPSIDPVTRQPTRDPNMPVNINYVYNPGSDEKPQEWMDGDVYFACYMGILIIGVYLPSHLVCMRLMPRAGSRLPLAA